MRGPHRPVQEHRVQARHCQAKSVEHQEESAELERELQAEGQIVGGLDLVCIRTRQAVGRLLDAKFKYGGRPAGHHHSGDGHLFVARLTAGLNGHSVPGEPAAAQQGHQPGIRSVAGVRGAIVFLRCSLGNLRSGQCGGDAYRHPVAPSEQAAAEGGIHAAGVRHDRM